MMGLLVTNIDKGKQQVVALGLFRHSITVTATTFTATQMPRYEGKTGQSVCVREQGKKRHER